MHLPRENGVSAAFLICDMAVRPMPDSTHNSALLNCLWGNFAAKNSSAAIVVVFENEPHPAASILFVVTSFLILLPFLCLEQNTFR